MTDIKTILPVEKDNQQAFIFDHGKVEGGVLKYQDDVTSYGWNTKQFNKVEEGAFVLNRHPGKITKDRKFEIYGGGYVEKIEKLDNDGNVKATISHAFRIVPPIKQGDAFIESFQWKSKKKKKGTWEHFWNQYGMNSISFEDFKELVEGSRCIPINDNEALKAEEEKINNNEVEELVLSGADINVVVEKEEKTKQRSKKHREVARKIDYKKIQAAKDKIGALGEEIVMNILEAKAKKEGLKAPIHVSKVEGDGLGYDIRCWDKNEEEIHVEVKSTKQEYVDGFDMSAREIEASKNSNYKYLIYRVYNLDLKEKKCNVKIYEGPINEDNFTIETKSVVVYKK